MEEILYKVIVDREVLAENMTLTNAQIFVKAYFETYWQEPQIRLIIQRMAYVEDENV